MFSFLYTIYNIIFKTYINNINTKMNISILNLNLYPKDINPVPKMKNKTSFIGI